MKAGYDAAIKEMEESIKGLQEDYEKKIRQLNNETKNLWEKSRQKDLQIREKNDEIRELNKGMEMGNAKTAELQEDLNRYKDLYFKLENEETIAKKKIQQLEWNVQDQSGKTTEINELREYIRKIEPQLIDYQGQIQRLVNELNQTKDNAAIELNQTKHNATIERDEMIKASRQELWEQANAEHNWVLAEKEKETQELKQKYSEMEETLNR